MLVEHVFCLKYNGEQDNIVYGLGVVLWRKWIHNEESSIQCKRTHDIGDHKLFEMHRGSVLKPELKTRLFLCKITETGNERLKRKADRTTGAVRRVFQAKRAACANTWEEERSRHLKRLRVSSGELEHHSRQQLQQPEDNEEPWEASEFKWEMLALIN